MLPQRVVGVSGMLGTNTADHYGNEAIGRGPAPAKPKP
jgi:hypothetical protein